MTIRHSGFAVVAQEVKSLANQAAKATDQITTEINGVQSISGDVVAALDSIRSSIETMRDHVVATVAAVEEHGVFGHHARLYFRSDRGGGSLI